MIYFIEDDRSIRELVVYTLTSSGFEAAGYGDGGEFFEALQPQKAELVLLDVMLPGEGGIEILKRLRAGADTADIPVIMVTARGAEFDKVVALDSGADDYITKPFGMMELLARIRAVLRRGGRETGERLTAGPVSLYLKRHTVTVGNDEVVLTFKEFELLAALLKNKGRVLGRDMLLETVWGYDYEGETRTVDVHIRTLRQKLGAGGAIIETVRGVGYRIGG